MPDHLLRRTLLAPPSLPVPPRLSLVVVLAALALLLHPFLTRPLSSASMSADLKKLMPQAKAVRPGPYTVESAGAQKVDGEPLPRRTLASKDALITTPAAGIETLYDVLRHSSAKFGNAKAVGARRIVQVHEETKKIKKMVDGVETEVDKKWQYFELSPYKYKSFVEFEQMALAVGSGIKALGFAPQDRLHLFAATSMQWLASAHGELCLGTFRAHNSPASYSSTANPLAQAQSHSPSPSSRHTTRSDKRASSTPCCRQTPRSCLQIRSCFPSLSIP